MSVESEEHCVSRNDDGTIAVTKALEKGNWVGRHYHADGRIRREMAPYHRAVLAVPFGKVERAARSERPEGRG